MNETQLSFRFLIFIMALVTLSFGAVVTSVGAHAADLKAEQIPSAQSSLSFEAPDSKTSVILRDAGFGLGAGVATGFLFSMMNGQNFSRTNDMLRSEAFGTGLVTGLIGGVITGVWQAKRAEAARKLESEKKGESTTLALSPRQPEAPAPANPAVLPPSSGASISF